MLRLAPVLLVLVGCYASHEVRPMTEEGCITELRPECVARDAGPCSPFRLHDALCEERSWACPVGTTERRRTRPRACSPFREAAGLTRLITVGPTLELGSTCVTMINGDVTATAIDLDHTGVSLDIGAAFGSCPVDFESSTPLLDRSVIGPDLVVDVMDTAEARGEAYSLVRLFVTDPDAVFGVTAIGSDFFQHDSDGSFAPTPRVRWRDGFYRSMLVEGDTLYVFTSLGEEGLMGRVGVSRASVDALVDASVPFETWEGRGWTTDRGVRFGVFEGGPQFQVSTHPDGRLVMTTVGGFGSQGVVLTSERPEGPWQHGADVFCDLPTDDGDAFCDSLRALSPLADPAVPDEIVVSYRIGSLAEDWEGRFRERPADYWGQMSWLRLR